MSTYLHKYSYLVCLFSCYVRQSKPYTIYDDTHNKSLAPKCDLVIEREGEMDLLSVFAASRNTHNSLCIIFINYYHGILLYSTKN